MSKPFSDLVEVVTWSPANPATNETPWRKEIQCAGV